MTSRDEQQLGLAAQVGQNPDSAAGRVERLQGAVERLNTVAKSLRTIASDIDWRGDAAQAAMDAFTTLAGAINQHADGINAVAAADAETSPALRTAYVDYQSVIGIADLPPGTAYYDQAGRTPEQYRADVAADGLARLYWSMTSAAQKIRVAASWDLEASQPPPAAAPGDGQVTGTVPRGSVSTPSGGPGGVDPIPAPTGTVPSGSGSGDGGVTGTVPPGSTSPGTGGVTGTVPTGPVDPGSGYDPAGTRPRDPGGSHLVAPSDRAAELAGRLGG